MIREQVTIERLCHGNWDHSELVWRIMEVADGTILKERVTKEGGSFTNEYFYFSFIDLIDA